MVCTVYMHGISISMDMHGISMDIHCIFHVNVGHLHIHGIYHVYACYVYAWYIQKIRVPDETTITSNISGFDRLKLTFKLEKLIH
jgi:hypothetical protein